MSYSTLLSQLEIWSHNKKKKKMFYCGNQTICFIWLQLTGAALVPKVYSHEWIMLRDRVNVVLKVLDCSQSVHVSHRQGTRLEQRDCPVFCNINITKYCESFARFGQMPCKSHMTVFIHHGRERLRDNGLRLCFSSVFIVIVLEDIPTEDISLSICESNLLQMYFNSSLYLVLLHTSIIVFFFLMRWLVSSHLDVRMTS